MDNLIVPSSIQRIRAFLVELCGMKVKPWASAEETLAALHATLVARQSCDIFWKSLQTLLETLARDMKVRSEAAPGALMDNEVLSEERYASLLDEIRARLAQGQTDTSSFRRLSQSLSASALTLLLLLGGVSTVACGSTPLARRPPDAAVADTRAEQPDMAPDNHNVIILPDMAPPKKDTAESKSDSADVIRALPDGAMVTIKDIMDSCNVPDTTQGAVQSCLSSMTESWVSGLAAYLAGPDCSRVRSATYFCDQGFGNCNRPSGSDFDPSDLPVCAPVLIYLGVRFV